MNISILTVFPELYGQFLMTSLPRRAQESGIVSYNLASFFSYCSPKERIDAPTVGHGSGMVIRPEVVQLAVEDKERAHGRAFRIFFSPQGKKLDQTLLEVIASKAQETNHVMLVAGRYEGMDARVEEYYADLVVSLGDFVIMGGDIPAMVLLEGLLRLIPGVVGKAESVEYDSFKGPFVDYPSFALPVVWQGMTIPEVLRSGDHARIAEWRQNAAIRTTVFKHFGWLQSQLITQEQKAKVKQVMPRHYVALMHTDVMLPDGRSGTTSVTSMDIHDIARSAATYGLENYFVVTPLQDQGEIVKTLLDFWQTGYGIEYNNQRHEAVSLVRLVQSLDDVINVIEHQEKLKPLLIATSARVVDHQNVITFFDQEKVWQENRPVVFILGTGKGLSTAVLERCDFLLEPVDGFTAFNHLSVRSAAAIILDRWLGLHHKR
jgi:tRNA (guanine37-N1)-methyltransferase